MRWILFSSLFFGALCFSQTLGSSKPQSRLTYDISGSQGTQNGDSYQEINLGLNWFLSDWLIWRNSAFQRQGTDITTVVGLDSSARLQQEWLNEERTLGFRIYGGPGVRLASSKHTAAFGEAGVGFRLGGIQIGAGVKSLRYFENREDRNRQPLPKDENQVVITISGSGSL